MPFTEITYTSEPAIGIYQATLNLAGPLSNGAYQFRVRASLQDSMGNGLNGGGAIGGGDFVQSFSVAIPQADLQVVIDPPGPAPNPALTGQPYGYTVTVTNNGPQTATNVVVSETDDSGGTQGMTLDPLASGGIQNTTTSVTYASLAPGGTRWRS